MGLALLFIPTVLLVAVRSLTVYVIHGIFDKYETLRGECSVGMSDRQKLEIIFILNTPVVVSHMATGRRIVACEIWKKRLREDFSSSLCTSDCTKKKDDVRTQ